MKTRIQIFLMVTTVCLVGCGDAEDPRIRPTVPVMGVVKFKGRPIPDATVCLHPVTAPEDGKPVFTPRGSSADDGTFTLATYRSSDGAPAGQYRVAVSWSGPLKGLSEDEQDRLKERLPRRYTNPNTSEITMVVSADVNPLQEILLD